MHTDSKGKTRDKPLIFHEPSFCINRHVSLGKAVGLAVGLAFPTQEPRWPRFCRHQRPRAAFQTAASGTSLFTVEFNVGTFNGSVIFFKKNQNSTQGPWFQSSLSRLLLRGAGHQVALLHSKRKALENRAGLRGSPGGPAGWRGSCRRGRRAFRGCNLVFPGGIKLSFGRCLGVPFKAGSPGKTQLSSCELIPGIQGEGPAAWSRKRPSKASLSPEAHRQTAGSGCTVAVPSLQCWATRVGGHRLTWTSWLPACTPWVQRQASLAWSEQSYEDSLGPCAPACP